MDINKKYLKEYKQNVDLMYAAAKSLGYRVETLRIEGNSSLDTLGFTVHYKDKTCHISGKNFFPTVSQWQKVLMSDKKIAYLFLKKFGYKQIPSRFFLKNKSYTTEQIKKLIRQVGTPTIVKPAFGFDGAGIKLAETLNDIAADVERLLKSKQDVIVQKFVNAEEYRIFAHSGELCFLHRKKFPEITGDGNKTITKLIEKEKYQDNRIVDSQLSKLGHNKNTVLKRGEKIIINITKKSDPNYYRTEDAPANIKSWTKKLCRTTAIETVGIDVFVEGSIEKPKSITIIELNSNPGLRYIGKYYKDYVTPFVVARDILKTYFS